MAPVKINPDKIRAFKDAESFYKWLGKHHDKESEIWIKIHKVDSVLKSITPKQAIDDFYPGYAENMTRIGKERGWPPMTRDRFDAQTGIDGALVVGSPEEVAQKILHHSDALGGISRFTFQMDSASLPHEKLMHAIELIGTRVSPLINPK